MAKKRKKKRTNTYFRQTAKAFKAARQTQIFSHIKRSIPYTISTFSRRIYNRRISKVKNSSNLPKFFTKEKNGYRHKLKSVKKSYKEK